MTSLSISGDVTVVYRRYNFRCSGAALPFNDQTSCESSPALPHVVAYYEIESRDFRAQFLDVCRDLISRHVRYSRPFRESFGKGKLGNRVWMFVSFWEKILEDDITR